MTMMFEMEEFEPIPYIIWLEHNIARKYGPTFKRPLIPKNLYEFECAIDIDVPVHNEATYEYRGWDKKYNLVIYHGFELCHVYGNGKKIFPRNSRELR